LAQFDATFRKYCLWEDEEGVRDLAIWDVLIAYVPVGGLSMSGEWLHVVSAASIFPTLGLLNEAVVQH